MGEAHKELSKGGQADFLSQTAGTLSEKQLRQIGHPYARSARVLSIDKLKGYRGLEENEVQCFALCAPLASHPHAVAVKLPLH